MRVRLLLIFSFVLLTRNLSATEACSRWLVLFPEYRNQESFLTILTSLRNLGITIEEEGPDKAWLHVKVPNSPSAQASFVKIYGFKIQNTQPTDQKKDSGTPNAVLVEYLVTANDGADLVQLAEALKSLGVTVDNVLDTVGIITIRMPASLFETVRALPEVLAVEESQPVSIMK